MHWKFKTLQQIPCKSIGLDLALKYPCSSSSNTRTGERTSRIISSRAERTAWLWSPMRTANGTTCPATTTCPTSARKAQVRGGGGKEARYHLASYRFHRWPPFVNWIHTFFITCCITLVSSLPLLLWGNKSSKNVGIYRPHIITQSFSNSPSYHSLYLSVHYILKFSKEKIMRSNMRADRIFICGWDISLKAIPIHAFISLSRWTGKLHDSIFTPHRHLSPSANDLNNNPSFISDENHPGQQRGSDGGFSGGQRLDTTALLLLFSHSWVSCCDAICSNHTSVDSLD